MTLFELNKIENDLYMRYNNNIPEACEELNNIQRQKINAVLEKYGTAYIGNTNYYGDERKKLTADKIFKEYNGQHIYNFAASIVIPKKDDKLEELILNFNKTSSPSILDIIWNRVIALGGANLIWS